MSMVTFSQMSCHCASALLLLQYGTPGRCRFGEKLNRPGEPAVQQCGDAVQDACWQQIGRLWVESTAPGHSHAYALVKPVDRGIRRGAARPDPEPHLRFAFGSPLRAACGLPWHRRRWAGRYSCLCCHTSRVHPTHTRAAALVCFGLLRRRDIKTWKHP